MHKLKSALNKQAVRQERKGKERKESEAALGPPRNLSGLDSHNCLKPYLKI